MKKKLSYILYIFIGLSICQPKIIHAQQVIIGSIAFPRSLKTVPALRIYAGGLKLNTQIDVETKRVTFAAPRERTSQYYMLITEKIYPVRHQKCKNKKNNTVEFLKIDPEQPYKLYSVELSPKARDNDISTSGALPNKLSIQNDETIWSIQKQTIDNNGRIPDQTIIVLYPAEYVETLQGGSEFELPAILIKQDIMQRVGSEGKLMEISNQLLLNCIDADTLHAAATQTVSFDPTQRRAIILPVT